MCCDVLDGAAFFDMQSLKCYAKSQIVAFSLEILNLKTNGGDNGGI